MRCHITLNAEVEEREEEEEKKRVRSLHLDETQIPRYLVRG